MASRSFYDVITSRRSIRKYKSAEIEDEKLDRILNAARIAPSAGNRQPWKFIVVRDKDTKSKLREAYDKEWFYNAPVIIVALGQPSVSPYSRVGRDFRDVDVSITFDHLILAAQAEGLGTCWIGAFEAEPVKKIFGIPDGWEPLALTPLGYPDESPDARPRKTIDEIVHWDEW